MRCSMCGSFYETGKYGEHFDHCPERLRQAEENYQRLAQTFHLKRGYPASLEGIASLRKAEGAVKKLLERRNSNAVLKYKAERLLESESWWYIPHSWIGCYGFIVDKNSGYVNWLGSSSTTKLAHCFWGHNRGLYCDLIDFAFAPDTDLEIVRKLVPLFEHMHPNARGIPAKEPVPYRDSEVELAIQKEFPLFKRHFVWGAIPEIQKATENDGLRFVANLSSDS